jgi:sugar-specific transcriptional regulator TrmB
MDSDKLREVGLNDKESKIYLTLLQLQEAIVSDIAKKSKQNRSSLYAILDSLCDKGIVTYIIKNNTRYYRAAEPEKLQDMLKDKEEALRLMMPELAALFKPMSKRPVIEILEGKEGIKTMLNDIIHQRQEWLAYTAPGAGKRIMGQYVNLFHKNREKEKIQLKAILLNTREGQNRAKELKKMKYTEVRFIPTTYKSPASNWVYSDRIAIMFWDEEFPFAVRIIDKKLADSYREHFKMIWNVSEKS